MLSILKSGLVFLTLCLGLTSAFKCRQCTGTQTITFVNSVTLEQATDFMRDSLGYCATGGEYQITNVSQTGLKFVFTLHIWRYCGTGGSNVVNRGGHCYNKMCSILDKRELTCTRTVKCADEGNCTDCNL